MIHAPLPPDEEARLRALREMGILFTPAEEQFERIVRLAARVLRAPMVQISLVDAQVVWFKAAYGARPPQVPRATSFCGHVILGDDTFVIPDTFLDERFRDNPAVTGPPFIRYYAGHPLRAADGSKVGTLCAMDVRPRRPTAAELEALRDLAGWAESELRMRALGEVQATLIAERDELMRRAMLDSVTRAWNREAILEVLERELARGRRDGLALSTIMADVDQFKRVNDTHGHQVGDAVLAAVVKNLRSSVRPYDAIGRYGGDEFLVVLPSCETVVSASIAERMRRRVAAERILTPSGLLNVTASLGVATSGPGAMTAEEIIAAADGALYRAKNEGRNRVGVFA